MSDKRVLRGFSNFGIFLVSKNTETEYTTGLKIGIPGAQSLSCEKEVDRWKIHADDGVYDVGADWKGHKFTLQLADLPQELRGHFEGGTLDTAKKELSFKSSSTPPEFAMSFMSSTTPTTREYTKIYSAKCYKVSFEHKTRGDNSNISVKIEGEFLERKMDKLVYVKKDGALNEQSWLSSVGLT